RPQPAPVHRRLHAPRKGILAGKAQPLQIIRVVVGRQVNAFHGDARAGRETLFTLGKLFQRWLQRFFFPARLLSLQLIVHFSLWGPSGHPAYCAKLPLTKRRAVSARIAAPVGSTLSSMSKMSVW